VPLKIEYRAISISGEYAMNGVVPLAVVSNGPDTDNTVSE